MSRYIVKHFANLPRSDMPGYTRSIEAYIDDYWMAAVNETLVQGESDKNLTGLYTVKETWVDADSAYLACRKYIKYYESGEGQLTDGHS